MEESKQTAKQAKYFKAIGRRRTAHANVRLYPVENKRELLLQGYKAKKGDIVVNGMRVAEYFPGAVNKVFYMKPFVITKSELTYFTSVQVVGGGKQAQRGAMVHGIARALESADKANRPLIKPYGLFTRDPRVKGRRKAGLAHKARAKEQSPKR